jgi:hypothetical protein
MLYQWCRILQVLKIVHHYQNTKEKLLKTNAAVLLNKMFRLNHLTPKYIRIKVTGYNAYQYSALLIAQHMYAYCDLFCCCKFYRRWRDHNAETCSSYVKDIIPNF